MTGAFSRAFNDDVQYGVQKGMVFSRDYGRKLQAGILKVIVHFRASFTKPTLATILATVNNTEANHEFYKHPYLAPRRSAEQWQALIDEWQDSGMSAAQLCTERAIGYASFCQWRKRLSAPDKNIEQERKAH